jgi:hypothetical protein
MAEMRYQREAIKGFEESDSDESGCKNGKSGVCYKSIEFRGAPRYPGIERDKRCLDKPQRRIQKIPMDEEGLLVNDLRFERAIVP